MVEWSRAFGGVPIHLHEADRQWVMRADPAVQSWGDTKPIAPGLALGFGWEATSTHRPALGRLEGRSRRTALGRHPSGGPERTRQLYVVSPEPYPALCREGSAHGADPGAIRIRRDL